MTSKRFIPLLITSIVLLVGSCAVKMNEAVPTSTAFLITATFPPTLTPAPTESTLSPPPQPMAPRATPVEGTSSTQINVRSEPSSSGNVLGIIAPNSKVEIVGKDPGGNWWQILYPQVADGKGWVTAQYVTTANGNDVPIVGGSGTDPKDGNVAIVQQQINVRSGPGTSYNSLGTLHAQDVVNLTGKDANGAWLQISYSSGPDGKGWVNAAFVQAHGVENLPIITEAGQVVGTGTPTGIPFTPSPTVIPAWQDNDSQNNPIVNVIFEPEGTHTLIYSGDISTPDGDSEDWINFKPYSESIYASLDCTGSASLEVEIWGNGTPINVTIACGDPVKQIDIIPGLSYSIHLYTLQSHEALQYSSYTIKVDVSP